MRIALYLLIMISVITLPQHAAKAAKDALRIWGVDVVPSLFPYMVLCRMLSQRLRAYRLAPAPIAALLGLLGGSPSGAAVIGAYADRLNTRMFYALCAMTGTISPMFMLGTMTAWTQNAPMCRMLLASHLLGAFFSGLCAYGLAVSLDAPRTQQTASQQENPITQSVHAILQVGGCIIFYSALAGLLRLFPSMQGVLGALGHGLLEISGGVHALASLDIHETLRCVALATLLGFGGFSILAQNHAFLSVHGVRMRVLFGFALMRSLGAGTGMVLMLALN